MSTHFMCFRLPRGRGRKAETGFNNEDAKARRGERRAGSKTGIRVIGHRCTETQSGELGGGSF